MMSQVRWYIRSFVVQVEGSLVVADFEGRRRNSRIRGAVITWSKSKNDSLLKKEHVYITCPKLIYLFF
jgi:hypothetical protein